MDTTGLQLGDHGGLQLGDHGGLQGGRTTDTGVGNAYTGHRNIIENPYTAQLLGEV